MSTFEDVVASSVLAPIDLHFALLMRRRCGEADADVIAVIAALLSFQRSRGHSCIDPMDWASRPFPSDSGPPLPLLPELGPWNRALDESGLIGNGSGPEPLVVDSAGRLYMARYWRAEQALAGHLRQRLEQPQAPIEARALAPLFRRLFEPGPESSSPSGQSIAAAAVLAGRVTLVTGGPGTGKTTTVGRVLALLLAADPELRIALAAPTGKAAARLGEAVAEQSARLPISDDQRARLPTTASTLHRLLGYQPRRDRFRHHARRPLSVGALVIDEVSMVDLLLMAATLEAVPPDARIILLGDKDQLTSVETGSVFGDLCAAAHLGDSHGKSRPEHSQGFADFYHALSGLRLPVLDPADSEPGSLLRDAAVELTTSFRFRDQPGIGELATSLRRGDADRALTVLADSEYSDVNRLEPPEEPHAVLEPLLEPLESYLNADSPSQALKRLARFRVLCARRRGLWGSETLNTLVERRLTTRGYPVTEGFYPARPIMITSNDYQLGLFNGDLGICWASQSDDESRDGSARLWAYFPGPDGELRRLPLAGLPPHETAWAMTVHKSQGSEFDRVLLVLGDVDSRVLTRELLYTGATRARRSVILVATPPVIRDALARRSWRVSGLADALTGTPAELPPQPAVELSTEPETEARDENDGSGQMSLFG